MTILKARKAMPTATAATVSRERHGDSFHVRVSLSNDSDSGDSDGDGAQMIATVIADFVAGRLSRDLTAAFDGKDVIILK